MLKKNVQKALNDQINAEIYSSYIYYSMSSYFDSINLRGFARWMRVQALEELAHAHKFLAFVYDRGGRAELKPVEGPANEWASPLAAFETAYNHEVKVTGMIHKLVDLAAKENDHATANMLQWFVAEQVEEEASADEIVQKLKMIGDSKGSVFMIDKELGKREFKAPSWLEL